MQSRANVATAVAIEKHFNALLLATLELTKNNDHDSRLARLAACLHHYSVRKTIEGRELEP
jgi:hypothetical protein